MPQQPRLTSDALESFRRIRGERLVDRFYQHFLAADERIRQMFAGTDLNRQKQMLQHGILMALGASRGDAIAEVAVRRLGQRHNTELGVQPEMYKTFIECLLRSAQELDPDWSPRTERAWRNDLDAGLAAMRRHREQPGG